MYIGIKYENAFMYPMDNVTVHEDISKLVGGHRYYLAERETGKGAFGFWVSEGEKEHILHGLHVSR